MGLQLLRQVVVNYVAMTPEGRIFENSLEKSPYDIRVGAGAVVPGLDEGLLSMKVRTPDAFCCWEIRGAEILPTGHTQ